MKRLRLGKDTGEGLLCRECSRVLAVYAKNKDIDILRRRPDVQELIDGDVWLVQEMRCPRCGVYTTFVFKRNIIARPPRASEHPVVYDRPAH